MSSKPGAGRIARKTIMARCRKAARRLKLMCTPMETGAGKRISTAPPVVVELPPDLSTSDIRGLIEVRMIFEDARCSA